MRPDTKKSIIITFLGLLKDMLTSVIVLYVLTIIVVVILAVIRLLH